MGNVLYMQKRRTSSTKSIDTTRRGFFRQFLVETICLVEEVKGEPQMRMSELDQVPDDVIRKMIPVFNESHSCRIEGDRLLMKHKKTGLFEEVCRMEPSQRYILRCFDGHHTLEDIGQLFEDRFGQDKDAGYQQVKSLFMFLAKRMICHPAHTYD